jgi:methyl-accepting chemotaxis protein
MFEKDPRNFEADVKGLSPEQKAMVKLEITLTHFFKSFNTSITRWERLVYPSLIVMAMLGLSGFYLIYNMTNDMKTLTQNVDPQMKGNLGAMAGHMSDLSQNIAIMTRQIVVLVEKVDSMDSHINTMDRNIDAITGSLGQVRVSMDTMTKNVTEMNGSVRDMTKNIAVMSHAVGAMTVNTGVMTRDINQMGRPMQFMNSFTPW